MARYKNRFDGFIEDTLREITIPPISTNRDYRDFLAWVAVGNTPDPADPAPIVYSGSRDIRAKLRTTDATPTVMYQATLQALSGYRALITLLGVDAGNGAIRHIMAAIVVKRLSGVAIMVGTPAILANHADTAASTWAVGATVTGNDFRITVTGAAGRDIDWLMQGDVLQFGPEGIVS